MVMSGGWMNIFVVKGYGVNKIEVYGDVLGEDVLGEFDVSFGGGLMRVGSFGMGVLLLRRVLVMSWG